MNASAFVGDRFPSDVVLLGTELRWAIVQGWKAAWMKLRRSCGQVRVNRSGFVGYRFSVDVIVLGPDKAPEKRQLRHLGRTRTAAQAPVRYARETQTSGYAGRFDRSRLHLGRTLWRVRYDEPACMSGTQVLKSPSPMVDRR